MIAEGVRDCGFAGADWVNELVRSVAKRPAQTVSSSGRPAIFPLASTPPHPAYLCLPLLQGVHDSVVEVLDTEMDPVRIVAAAPDANILTKGGLGACVPAERACYRLRRFLRVRERVAATPRLPLDPLPRRV